MTQNAREVLDDCRLALQMLEGETESRRWRVLWVAAAALVRAVGHVLSKVDGRDPVVKRVGDQFFENWKRSHNHRIFRDFIEQERNSILKEYQSSVHPMEKVYITLQTQLVSTIDGSELTISDPIPLDGNVYRPMLDGPWQGDDCRDVLQEAIVWWEQQLDLIDAEVRRTQADATRP